MSDHRDMARCWAKIGIWGDSSCERLQEHIHCRNCPIFTREGRRLFDRQPPAGYVRMWTDLLARAKADRRGGGRSVVVFRVGREWFGLNTDCFQSIANIRPIHSLPHLQGRIVLGLANIEGELVLCASLAELLGLETADEPESAADERRQPGGSGRILVLDGPDGRWAAPVDEVWGVYRLPDDQVEAAPATLAKAKTNHVQGLFAIDEHHAAWLDERLVFNSLSRSIR